MDNMGKSGRPKEHVLRYWQPQRHSVLALDVWYAPGRSRQLVTGNGPRGIQRGDDKGGDRRWHAAWHDHARPWLWWCTGQHIISVWHLAAYRLLLSLACGRTNGPIYSWAALNPVGGKARCLHVSRGLQCYVARQAAF